MASRTAVKEAVNRMVVARLRGGPAMGDGKAIEATMLVYLDPLEELDDVRLEAAVMVALRTKLFFPSPGELIELAPPKPLPPLLPASPEYLAGLDAEGERQREEFARGLQWLKGELAKRGLPVEAAAQSMPARQPGEEG